MLHQFMKGRSHSNVTFATTVFLKKKKNSLKSHVASVHEGNKPFKCDICDYSCSLKQYMKQHVAKKHKGNQQP